MNKQNRLKRKSEFDKAERIDNIHRVTRVGEGDGGRIVRKKTVEAGVTEVSGITDIKEKSNGRHVARGKNGKRLTRNTVRSPNSMIS